MSICYVFCVFLIIVIFLLLFLWKCRREKKEKEKDPVQSKLKESNKFSLSNYSEEILQNLGVYICIVNKQLQVVKTNYYDINMTSEPKEPMLLGNVLKCKNGEDAGLCGEGEACKHCLIRKFITNSFIRQEGFDDLEVPMYLYISRDKKKYIDCVVNISAKLLNVEVDKYLLLTINDISKYKILQKDLEIARDQAKEANEQKSAFISNMSHEVRTPLNAIVGFSDLLITTTDETKKKSYIDIIHTNNELLLSIVNDVLDLSKLEKGTFDLSYSKEDLNIVMCGLEETFRRRLNITGKPVQLIFIPSEESCYIEIAKNRVIQVFSNLLTNAIKNTDKGSITFGYNIQGGKIYCYVTDTGIGIPKNEINNIFHRFIKLNVNKSGTGLGLSISKFIVEKMGGQMGVESEVGHGSTFWFTLPMQRMIPDEKKQESSNNQKIIYNVIERKKLKILIAEHLDPEYNLLKDYLNEQYALYRAFDGEEAVSIFFKEMPDIIFIDLMMPKVNGYEATDAIRQISTSVFIVAMADLVEKEKINFFLKGFNAFLSLPINKQQLFDILKTSGV